MGASALTPVGAWAETCVATPIDPSAGGLIAANIGVMVPSLASSVVSAVTAANVAFLGQNTAFVGGAGESGQIGGGAWARAIGGRLDVSSTSTTTQTAVVLPGTPINTASGTVNCNSKIHTRFGGIQVGADLAKFDIGGWNGFVGVTAGTLKTNNSLVGGVAAVPGVLGIPGQFDSGIQVPFFGVYAAAARGGFFIDAMLRRDFYRGNFNSPGTLNIFDQNLNARGISVSSSAGYRWTIPDTNWFVEPSVGVVISRVNVDPFNTAGPDAGFLAGAAIKGAVTMDQVKNTIARAGLRVGGTVAFDNIILQPFVSASIWHDFEKTYSANYRTCPGVTGPAVGCVFFGGLPALVTGAFRGQNIGTFGQYSAGVTGQIANTGWIGFARLDYRHGENVQGWSANLGVRYSFSPDRAPPVISKDGPREAALAAVNWNGFYVGGNLGAQGGRASLGFNSGDAPAPRPSGLLGGLQAGYNFQFANAVFGLEGDVTKTSVTGATPCRPLVANTGVANVPLFNMTCNSSTGWLWSLVARGGFAWDRALFFAKLGPAWSQEQVFASCNNDPNVVQPLGQNCVNPAGAIVRNFTANGNRLGITTGVGFEFAMTRNVSIKAEYNYGDFGRKSMVAGDGTAISSRKTTSDVRIGFNYRFGG